MRTRPTDGIAVEFDGAGEDAVDRDDNALRARLSHRLLEMLHSLRINATTTRDHCNAIHTARVTTIFDSTLLKEKGLRSNSK